VYHDSYDGLTAYFQGDEKYWSLVAADPVPLAQP
jgi:hypothetical protein